MNNNRVALQTVINTGLGLMSLNVTKEQYENWISYSKSVLSMVSNNPSLMTNYLGVILSASNPSLMYYQKISMCLRYLIGIQHLI